MTTITRPNISIIAAIDRGIDHEKIRCFGFPTGVIALPGLAQARPVTLTTELQRYGGNGAYLAFYLTDANGQYKKTLWVAGKKAKYYKNLRDWARGSGSRSAEFDGVSGASVGSGSTLKVTVELADALIDAGYEMSALTGIYMSAATFGLVPDGMQSEPDFPSMQAGRPAAPITALPALLATDVNDLRELVYPKPNDPSDVYSLRTVQGDGYRARGMKPDGRPWAIAIEKPIRGVREAMGVMELADAAIATSGDYRHWIRIGNKYYSHTIDPSLGRPSSNRLAAVSVVASSCMLADAWALRCWCSVKTRGRDWQKNGVWTRCSCSGITMDFSRCR